MDNAVHTTDKDEPIFGIFLTGILFGVLAGFGAVILSAPNSGKKTRSQIGLLTPMKVWWRCLISMFAKS